MAWRFAQGRHRRQGEIGGTQGEKRYSDAGRQERIFGVDDKTEFWGPKGGDRGTGAKGLKDETMSAGYEIKLTASKDGKTARNVYLSDRKEEKKNKK